MTRPSTPGNSDSREFGRIVDQRWYNGTANVDRFTYTYDRDSNVLTKVNTNHTANSMTYMNGRALPASSCFVNLCRAGAR